ncbi:MAG: zinc ribbon domain-containing protein [Ignavibacteria bacterium]
MTSEEEKEPETFECSHCGNPVDKDDEFCTDCGTIFEEDVKCSVHINSEALGVCVICCLPFCNLCGNTINNHFLCNTHSDYEIYQGMVRVYGDLDDTNVQYASSCLKQAGLHPFIYCRVQPKGGSRLVYSLYEANGDSSGHIVNEIKVMVPAQEVVAAEDLLRDLKILQ